MDLFEQKFQLAMSSKVALLNRITHYIVNRKGKQMRPMFVFLVAKMVNNGEISERTYRGASVIELIHTASLVHDDVVDDSNRRRGFFSINALWKNKIAVLVGDYLLSKGLLLAVENEENNEKIAAKDHLRLAVCGLFGVATNQILFFEGLNLTSPINAAVIMTTNPVLVLVMSSEVRSRKRATSQW